MLLPVAAMTNQEAKRALLLQYQAGGRLQDAIHGIDVDRLGDREINHLYTKMTEIDANVQDLIDRIKATGG